MVNKLPSNMRQAKEENSPHYYTGRPCKHGHTANRITSTGNCMECHRLAGHKFRKQNVDKCKAYSKFYRETKAEQKRVSSKLTRQKNKEKYYQRSRLWFKLNPHKLAFYVEKRRATKLNATPRWADWELIEAIYAERNRISKETGVQYHVDHIVPLQGKAVCGLHVHYNMQLLTASENIRKGNKFMETGNV